MRFLIVDDNPADRELITHRIRQEFPDVDLVEAGSSRAFEEALRQGDFDLVLSDYALQWSDGLTVVRRVQERYPDVPVVMVTDSGNEEVAVQAMKQGLSDYLLKRHLERLPLTIRESLDRARLRRENERMAERLRLSEARYRAISGMTSDYAFAYRIAPSGETITEWVTDAFYRITGYTDEEVKAAGGWMVMLHPDDKDIAAGHRERLLAGQVDTVEYRIITRQGALRWLRVVGQPELEPETGRVARVYGAAQDITDRRLAEKALRSSEARFRAIFSNAGLGIIVVTGEGRLLDANPAMAHMLDYARETLTGMSITELTHPDDREMNADLFGSLVRDERSSYKVEKRYVRSDGGIVWARVVMSQVSGPEDVQPFVVGVVEDITQQRAALAALIEAEKLALTGTLAASIAHEVNNPMQAVVGCVGLAIEKLTEGKRTGDLDPTAALQLLEIASREMRRADHIIAQLRDLNRRSMPDAWRLVNLGDVVESVLTLSGGETSAGDIAVVKEIEPDLPPVRIVPARIQQVLVGLILNAIAAMPGGGTLRVTVRREPAGSGEDVPSVVVSLADTGVGIRPENMRRLFEPFFSTKEQGVGLGLHLSRNIVREHGGEITVHSIFGAGTTVELSLPAVTQA